MSKKKVMVVDDDREFLEELCELLVLSGYEMVSVNDPAAALQIAVSEKPQVILIDLKMPGKSGFQLAEEFRGLAQLEQVSLIAMSAFFKEEYKPLLSICGIKRCLKKPFHPLEAITEIEAALAEKL
ncbi:MAG: response regulator [Candidatus Omnitrophica bacterium]|nr:response regulator [Candidatus Omnitrophota bacterium]